MVKNYLAAKKNEDHFHPHRETKIIFSFSDGSDLICPTLFFFEQPNSKKTDNNNFSQEHLRGQRNKHG